MRSFSKTAPHGRSFLRRVFAVNLAWGVILYLLIGENQEASLWINPGSFASHDAARSCRRLAPVLWYRTLARRRRCVAFRRHLGGEPAGCCARSAASS
jgi:hypothetical protein